MLTPVFLRSVTRTCTYGMSDSTGSTAASEFWAMVSCSSSQSTSDSDGESDSDVNLRELYESFDYNETVLESISAVTWPPAGRA